MAIKPTIYKLKIALSDLNNDFYDTLNLTIALHPSETPQRMMARLMAFCLHACHDKENLLSFTKGLSAIGEPDIWLKGLDDQLHLWIDIGEPSFDRLKKACRLAKRTLVYSFNSKSAVWWKQSQAQFSTLPIEVLCFDWHDIQQFSQLLSRTMDLSITITGDSAFIASDKDHLTLNWRLLQG
jgi:uncharacterized protein YaeQ